MAVYLIGTITYLRFVIPFYIFVFWILWMPLTLCLNDFFRRIHATTAAVDQVCVGWAYVDNVLRICPLSFRHTGSSTVVVEHTDRLHLANLYCIQSFEI